jgi:hypothetical protein
MAALPAACNALLGADAPTELPDASGPATTTTPEAASPQDVAADTAKTGAGNDGSLEASMGAGEAAADSPQERSLSRTVEVVLRAVRHLRCRARGARRRRSDAAVGIEALHVPHL